MADQPKMKKYILKKGAVHTVIIDGDRKDITGDGTVTVDLSDTQAAAFRDKLQGSGELDNQITQDAVDATTGGVPVNGASSGASAASAGTPIPPAVAEDAEVLVASTDGKAKEAVAEDKKAADKK
jgi:hypothetical protein